MPEPYSTTETIADDVVLPEQEGTTDNITVGTNTEDATIGSPTLTEGPPAGENVSDTGYGGTGGNLTILSSPSMEWFFDPSKGKWYASYKLPNSRRRLFFQANPSDMDQIFGEGMRPTNYKSTDFTALSQREGYTFAGGIIEVAGSGTFDSSVEQAVALALDEGILPKWAMNDPAVMDLLYIAASEEKSAEWLNDELAKLPSFKARFPSVDQMKNEFNLTTSEAVKGFLEMENGVKAILQRSGLSTDVTPELIGELITKGQSLDDVAFVYTEFERLQDNQGALDAFNEVLAARGLAPLDGESQLEFLSGNAPKELYEIWEEASFNTAQEEAGLNLSVQDAMNLAGRTVGSTSFDQASEALNIAAQNILRHRADIALDRYDIDQEDLIDLSLGLTPRSGRTQAEMARNMERAISAARAGIDGPRKQPFRSFTGEGIPQAASLSKSKTKR